MMPLFSLQKHFFRTQKNFSAVLQNDSVFTVNTARRKRDDML